MPYPLGMTRKLFKFINGECVQVAGDVTPEVDAPAVHQDTFKTPLRHPKTDEMVDSMTRWNQINKEHKLECVGNDLLSKYKRNIKEKVTEERFNDAYDQAWNIETDPFKRNQQRNKQREELERHYDAQAKVMRPSMSKAEIMQMLGLNK